MRIAPIAAVAVLLVSGPACSDDGATTSGSTATIPPSPSALGPPASTGPYRSIDSLVAAIEEKVGPVEVQHLGPGNNADTLKDFAIIDWDGVHTNVYLFEDKAQRDLWLPQISAEFELLYGPNWIVIPFGATDLLRSLVGGKETGGP